MINKIEGCTPNSWTSEFGVRPSIFIRSGPYFGVTALVPTPPPADFTQTEVGRSEVTPRNAQVPLAALTPAVVMRVPGQLPLTGLPVKIETLAAKPPPAIGVLTPFTRSSPVART